MINVSNNGGTSSCRYILRSDECITAWSNIGASPPELLKKVAEYERFEKEGNPDLGIRGRHDAQTMKKLIISLPNDLKTEELKNKIGAFLNASGIADYPHLVAIHNGANGEAGVLNRHAHINFFQRKFEKGDSKKNRAFSQRLLATELRGHYQTAFGFKPGTELTERARVDRRTYQDEAKSVLAEFRDTARIYMQAEKDLRTLAELRVSLVGTEAAQDGPKRPQNVPKEGEQPPKGLKWPENAPEGPKEKRRGPRL